MAIENKSFRARSNTLPNPPPSASGRHSINTASVGLQTIQNANQPKTTTTPSLTTASAEDDQRKNLVSRLFFRVKGEKKERSPEPTKQEMLEAIFPALDKFINKCKDLTSTEILNKFITDYVKLNLYSPKAIKALRPEMLTHITMMQKGKLLLTKKIIKIEKGFDREHPINRIKREDVLSTFRAFYNESENPSFTINHTKYKSPDLSELKLSDSEKELRFMTWLIESFDTACEELSPISAAQQAALVCTPLSNYDISEELKEHLSEILKKHDTQTSSVEPILKELAKLECPEFYAWAKEELMRCFEDKDATHSVRNISQAFSEYKWAQRCLQSVPCFPILQAASISAYPTAVYTLKDKFCPRLFSGNVSQLHLKNLPTNRTSFNIEYNRKVFSVDHVKRYDFIKGNTQQYQSYGSANVHWKICSNRSKIITANLWATQLSLSPLPADTVELIEHFYN